jgi:drug/metabolite transporter (DMT)-like permease
MERTMRKLGLALRILVGLVFLAQGVFKLTGVQNEWRDDLQVASWFWVLIGIMQVVGALALFVSLKIDWLAVPAGLLFVGIMVGAIGTHIRVSDPVVGMIFPAVMLLASLGVAWIAWRDDQVLRPRVTGRVEKAY